MSYTEGKGNPVINKPKVRNPYVSIGKKSSNGSLTSSVSSTNHQNHHVQAPIPTDAGDDFFVKNGSSTYSASTFSQAFATVESSEKYQQEISILQTNNSQGNNNIKGPKNRVSKDLVIANTTITKRATKETNPIEKAQALDDRRYNHAFLHAHVLHVSPKQRGNAVLKFIRNVPFQYSQIVPDFILGSNRCALFLSLKYHTLHPSYIQRRISELKNDFTLRVLLCLVDMDDNATVINTLNRTAVFHNLSLILAWSNEEAARYLETFKAFESKDASSIQKREKELFADQVADVLTSVRSVNKTDSAYLVSQFGTLKQLVGSSADELSLCHGIGERKVQRLYNAFNKPFRKRKNQSNDAKDNDEDSDTNQRNRQGVYRGSH